MSTEIEGQIKTLCLLMQGVNLEGISEEEKRKILEEISDKAILEVMRRGLIPREIIEELLRKRMAKWSFERLIEIVEARKGKYNIVAYFALVTKLLWGATKKDLKKIEQSKSRALKKALIESRKKKKRINEIRWKLGLEIL